MSQPFRLASGGSIDRSRPLVFTFDGLDYQGYAGDGFSVGTVCAINCNNGQGAYSFHPAGENVLFCDGSVHFMNELVAVETMYALCSSDGAETVDVGNEGL